LEFIPQIEAASNTWNIFVTATVTEPFLGLSSWINKVESDEEGFIGLRQLFFQWTTGDTSRVWSSANDYITSISLGGTTHGGTVWNAFSNTQIFLMHKDLQPTEYAKIKKMQILPYYNLPYQITNVGSTSTLASGTSNTYTSSNLQLSVIPSLFVIAVREQLTSQNWTNSQSFLVINSISILFNNQSGLLSSMTPVNLWEMSRKNGSNQTWENFRGYINGDMVASTGSLTQTPTTGSVLFIKPAYDLRLADFLSAGS